MHKFVLSGLVLATLSFSPAFAAEITDAAKCTSEVEIIKQLDADSDIGQKFEPAVKDLIEVVEELCEGKAFEQADHVAAVVRGMLATE